MSNAALKQNWSESITTGRKAIAAVKDFLGALKTSPLWFQTIHIHDIQDDPRYQPIGIDLLWLVEAASSSCAITVEVKGDTNDHTGNFFIETVSDVAKNTPGAFIACKAEWYFYYFINTKTLYCIPMMIAKPWFEKNKASFKERFSNSTRAGRTWKTKGCLVPKYAIENEIEDLRIFQKTGDRWIKR